MDKIVFNKHLDVCEREYVQVSSLYVYIYLLEIKIPYDVDLDPIIRFQTVQAFLSCLRHKINIFEVHDKSGK